MNGSWVEPVMATHELAGVWGSGGTVYAVGRGGLVKTFDGAAWTEQTLGQQNLTGISGISGSNGNAIAVADDGTIWRISPP